jgi:hypothetical protein
MTVEEALNLPWRNRGYFGNEPKSRSSKFGIDRLATATDQKQ